jgi:DNA-binding response OmpR family regulator
MRLLVVEDEPKVAEAVREVLAAEQYDVLVAHTGDEGFSRATRERFDAIVLDVMLPQRDGLDVLTSLRGRGDLTPREFGLRKKVEADFPTGLIHTVRGVGFMFREGAS